MDKGEVMALTLLDLSAASDNIDHATLTDRLSDWYGISGQAQIWFSSYLQNRHHRQTDRYFIDRKEKSLQTYLS